MRQTLPKISADAHVDEPHDLWFERLAPDLRDRAPRRIQAESDGGWTLVIDDSPLGWSDVSAEQAAENEEARIAAVAPDARFEMMRSDGVNAEIVYPTIGLYAWNVTDPVVGRECCRVYNDWILERLGGTDRIRVAAMIPTWDVEMAVEEVRRVARARVGQRSAAPARRHARVEPAGVGAALVDHRSDRDPGSDAPGHRPRHDLLPRMGLADREPARDPVDGPARRRVAELQRRAGTTSRPARGHGRGERRLDGMDHVDARRVLHRAPAQRLDEAHPR